MRAYKVRNEVCPPYTVSRYSDVGLKDLIEIISPDGDTIRLYPEELLRLYYILKKYLCSTVGAESIHLPDSEIPVIEIPAEEVDATQEEGN